LFDVVMLQFCWPAASPLLGAPAIDHEQVHVWCTSLDDPPVPVQQLSQTLTAEERLVSARGRSQLEQQRAVASRGLLRVLLGAYLSVAPETVPLRALERGKPATEGLDFNVAHSEELILLALARGRDIGVDIERLRSMPRALDVAARYFSPGELRALRTTPPREQQQAFLLCWTRKEAYVKARGTGIAFPLRDFDVTFDTAENPSRIATPGEAREWWSYGMRPAVGFVGALATTGRVAVLTRTWLPT
jgi:4'-phosphopantetheinyl transferase